MKLELKHLAPYLPYKLQAIGKNKIVETGLSNFIILFWQFSKFKPILRPLSDLTKEIEVNGKKFIPIKIFENIVYGINVYKSTNYPLELTVMTCDYSQEIDYYNGYLIVQKLLEWHFDIFGLIEAGLAIDINTVKF